MTNCSTFDHANGDIEDSLDLTTKVKRLNLRIDNEIDHKLHIVCALSGISKSTVVEAALSQFFQSINIDTKQTISDMTVAVRSFFENNKGHYKTSQ